MSLYPEGLPGQVLPVTSQDTYASVGAPLTVVGGGGSGPVPVDVIRTSTISFNTATNTSGSFIDLNSEAGLFLLGPGDTSISLDGAFNLTYNAQNGTGGRLTEDNKVFSFNDAFNIDASGNLLFQGSRGAITGLSTVNGAPYGSGATVPANPLFSTVAVSSILNFQGNTGAITNLSTINGAPYGAAAVTADPLFSTVAISSILNFQGNTGAITNLSTINGAPYAAGGSVNLNPTFSTIQVSTITTPINPVQSPATTQTINTLIGGMRIQGGVCYCTSASYTTVTWANAFGTVPIVLTGAVGLTQGSGTTATVSGAGEASGQFTVNAAASTGVYWLCIGAA